MTSLHTQVAALLATFVTATVVSSCATASKEDHSVHASSTSAEQVAAHDADDIQFAQLMIPHHQQAVELAAMVPDRSTNPDVIALAAKVASEQQPEISTMKALLLQWNVNLESHESGHAGMAMQGMVDDATMVKLDSLKGGDFDTLWLQAMISHHQGAIEMAKTEIADGTNADLISLAKNIVTAQQAEVDQMRRILGA